MTRNEILKSLRNINELQSSMYSMKKELISQLGENIETVNLLIDMDMRPDAVVLYMKVNNCDLKTAYNYINRKKLTPIARCSNGEAEPCNCAMH